jgi:hypothetical protein
MLHLYQRHRAQRFEDIQTIPNWYLVAIGYQLVPAEQRGYRCRRRHARSLLEDSKEMSTFSIEALASAWARIAEEAEFPVDYEGTASPEAHRASEAIQEKIRTHIVATNDMRLFGLLHLLGHASLRMERALWPEDYERVAREIEQALREADDVNARSYSHEEVTQSMRERIYRARDKAR